MKPLVIFQGLLILVSITSMDLVGGAADALFPLILCDHDLYQRLGNELVERQPNSVLKTRMASALHSLTTSDDLSPSADRSNMRKFRKNLNRFLIDRLGNELVERQPNSVLKTRMASALHSLTTSDDLSLSADRSNMRKFRKNLNRFLIDFFILEDLWVSIGAVCFRSIRPKIRREIRIFSIGIAKVEGIKQNRCSDFNDLIIVLDMTYSCFGDTPYSSLDP
ncbi:hypothetical protein CTI12_AA195560 [Artemisia annua]|uniref:Uncharacterized protein n=1 Tax=Artemisia annua TaxID=35608 RepID=A0A2U1P4F6_ARTAN|nr:hypothetical protein CTI12_AA195560 [Artemisia annua]